MGCLTRSSPPGPRDRDTLHFDFWPVEGGRSSGDFRGGPQAVCSGALHATLSGPVRNHLALDEVYTLPPNTSLPEEPFSRLGVIMPRAVSRYCRLGCSRCASPARSPWAAQGSREGGAALNAGGPPGLTHPVLGRELGVGVRWRIVPDRPLLLASLKAA